jgi:hypothetical protein
LGNKIARIYLHDHDPSPAFAITIAEEGFPPPIVRPVDGH